MGLQVYFQRWQLYLRIGAPVQKSNWAAGGWMALISPGSAREFRNLYHEDARRGRSRSTPVRRRSTRCGRDSGVASNHLVESPYATLCNSKVSLMIPAIVSIARDFRAPGHASS